VIFEYATIDQVTLNLFSNNSMTQKFDNKVKHSVIGESVPLTQWLMMSAVAKL